MSGAGAALNPAADFIAKLEQLSPFGARNVELRRAGTGANLFTGPIRVTSSPTPAQALFALNSTGTAPMPYLGQDTDFQRFSLEVSVRSNPGDYDGGEELTRAVMMTCQRQAPTGYIAALVQQAGPEYIGEDDQRQHQWRFFVVLFWKG